MCVRSSPSNVGTNPIQSQRLFEALNGLGKTVQLVEYPYEDHGPVARETVLDYWARALDFALSSTDTVN